MIGCWFETNVSGQWLWVGANQLPIVVINETEGIALSVFLGIHLPAVIWSFIYSCGVWPRLHQKQSWADIELQSKQHLVTIWGRCECLKETGYIPLTLYADTSSGAVLMFNLLNIWGHSILEEIGETWNCFFPEHQWVKGKLITVSTIMRKGTRSQPFPLMEVINTRA